MNIKLSDLTAIGWALVVVAVVATGFAGLALFDNLPPGRYPAAGIIVVVAVVGGGVFAAGAFALRLVGVKVLRPTTPADEVAARAASAGANSTL